MQGTISLTFYLPISSTVENMSNETLMIEIKPVIKMKNEVENQFREDQKTSERIRISVLQRKQGLGWLIQKIC